MNDQQSQDRAKIQAITQDLAREVLQREKAYPGLQDPDLLRWASNKLSSNNAPVSTIPASPPPVPQQVQQPLSGPTPVASVPAGDQDDEGVLHIQRPPEAPSSQVYYPQQNNIQGQPAGESDYTQDNGENNNGNSN